MFHSLNLSLIPVSGCHSYFLLNATAYFMQMSLEFCLPFARGLAKAREGKLPQDCIALSWLKSANKNSTLPPHPGVLLRVLGGGVPPSCPNANHSSEKKVSFSTPVFRPRRSQKMQNTCLHTQKLCHRYLDWNTKEKIS